MSLINKVLRDLDNRLPASGDSPDVSLSNDVRVVKQMRRYSTSRLFFLFLMLCLTGAFAWWITMNLTMNDQSSIEPSMKVESSVIQSVDHAAIQQSNSSQVVTEPANAQQQTGESETVKEPHQKTEVEAVTSVESVAIAPQTTENPVEAPVQNEKKLSSPLQLEQEGMQALREGRINTGLSQLNEALKLNPRLLMGRISLARQLEHMGRRNEAESILTDGLMLLPNSPLLFLELSRLHYRANNVNMAFNLLTTIINSGTENPDVHGFYAQLLKDKKSWDLAINHYKIALQRKNFVIDWRIGLADSLAQLGNIDAAKAEFNTALRYSNASFRQRQYIQSRLGELM